MKDLLCVMDNQYQIDVILLDSTKAFDKVSQRCQLTKLLHYGIKGYIHKWIETWLVQQTQQVVVDGESSCSTLVTSGVAHGTVLALLMFLIYVNDISDSASSTLLLFADDCLLNRVIKSEVDTC